MTTKNESAEAVLIERTFNAPVARVWKALTDVDQMRHWYFDLKEFKLEPGFEFEFTVEHEGVNYCHLCKVVEVIPQKKLAYTWRYRGEPGDSLVTFVLFPEGCKTRLKLTHEGFETFPKLPAYAKSNFEAGWTSLIGTSLKDYLENADRRLVISRDFNAPRDRVWKAWTEPAQIKQWLGAGEGMKIESMKMDLRVGGKFRIQQKMADGEFYTAVGTYLEVKVPERLVYTWDWEKDGGGTEFGELEGSETQVTVEFQARGKQTHLVLTHEKFASAESRDRHEEGWQSWLGKLAKFVEGK
jgi:uncharacterized protein YndB with AHSA1/START domain